MITPGYRVTRDGRVFSPFCNWRGLGEREMKPSLNSNGYPSVRLTIDGQTCKRVRLAVHRLVAREFLGPRPSPEHVVRHLNGDKTDNRAVNLAWGTAKENSMDRERHGRTARGDRHGMRIKAIRKREQQEAA